MTKKSALSTSAVLLLLLGLLHTARLVDSFSSSLAQSKSCVASHQQSIIQSTRTSTAKLALRVATGVAEEISSSGSDGGGAPDDNSGLPEFGADGLYHITNEAEYK